MIYPISYPLSQKPFNVKKNIKIIDFKLLVKIPIRVVKLLFGRIRRQPAKHTAETLKAAVIQGFKNGNLEEFDRILRSLTLSQMIQILKLSEEDCQTILENFDGLAKFNLSRPKVNYQPSNSFLKLAAKLWNTILITFSLLESGKEPDSYFEGAYLLEIFYKFLLIPIALFLWISRFFQPLLSLGITLATTIITVAIIRFSKRPLILPNFCENLTQKALEGKIIPVRGREMEIQNLVDNLLTKTEKRVCLIGEAGIGKTSIASTLAYQIVNGEIPSLKGKQVILVNTASLIPAPNTDFKIQKPIDLLKQVVQNRDDVILFYDELQGALKGEGVLVEELKNKLPKLYFGAATKNDYTLICKNDGLHRRFREVIEVSNTNYEETFLILRNWLKENGSQIELTKEVLEPIYNATKEQPQPSSTKDILAKIVLAIDQKNQGGPLVNQLKELKHELEKLKHQIPNPLTLNTLKDTKLLTKIRECEDNIKFVEKKISLQNQNKEVYDAWKEWRDTKENSLWSNPKNNKLQFLFTKFQIETLDEMLEQYPFKTKIDDEMIKQFIKA